MESYFFNSFFIRSMLESTPNRVAANTKNWAMVMRMLWSTSPCGGSNIAHTAMMLATSSATAERISFTVHILDINQTAVQVCLWNQSA